MANFELEASIQETDLHKEEDGGGFESDDYCTVDDSDDDPTFDIVEETRSRFTKISLKKSRPRKVSDKGSENDEDEEETCGIEIPELDEKDGKCFEKVEELIKDGHVEKLKLDQCKVYLRKYGLRLTGNKAILIERIKEHLEIMNGGGQKKYPISSFVLNCKGDACTGDIVMFEQKVYEMFSIISKSATGPPCGTRVVAGRIVKESYGAAKQQHTFTIEVLWSTGEKPLPPLHPLLIKGRNLYRLKTMRRRWTDEEERRRVLQEKHSRGFVARCSRDTRIKGKEKRKMANTKRKDRKSTQQPADRSQVKVVQQQEMPNQQHLQHQDKENSVVLPPANPIVLTQQPNISHHRQFHHHQMETKVIRQPIQNYQHPMDNAIEASKPEARFWNYSRHNTASQIPKSHDSYASYHHYRPPCTSPQKMHIEGNRGRSHPQVIRHNFHNKQPLSSSNHCEWNPPMQRNWARPRQRCPYYRRGRCYYGENCKYLHE